MYKHIKKSALSSLAVALIISACANAESESRKDLKVESMPGIASDLGSTPAVVLGAGLQRLVDMATKNLATELGIGKDKITVAQAKYVTWRDSSLGCPKPDMAYMQIMTNGSQIILKANTTVYHYHSGGDRPPSYCSTPAPQEPLPYEHGAT